MKYIVAQACLVAGASMALTSCNDFLDREPLDQVTPQEYFQTADHLAAYTISKYNSMQDPVSGKSAHKKAALRPNAYTKPVSGFGIVGTQGGR